MSKTRRDKGGRPPFEPTAEQRKLVETLAAYGVQQNYIAEELGITRPTLAKHFDKELRNAEQRANAKVAESLFKKATGDGAQAVTAAIWWTKARMGWKEQKDVNVTVNPWQDIVAAASGEFDADFVETDDDASDSLH